MIFFLSFLILFNQLNKMISSFCKLILMFFGWEEISLANTTVKSPDNLTSKPFNSLKRKITIYTHTSFFDFFVSCIYRGAEPDFRQSIIPMDERYCNRFFSYFFNCIPVPSKPSKTGFVKTVVDVLKKRDSCTFVISPEGSLSKTRWKSGYYYIAKTLSEQTGEDVYIVPFGANYEKHNIFVGHYYNVKDYTLEELEPILQKELEYMVPLHPEHSFTPSIYKRKPTLMNYKRVFFFLLVLWTLSYLRTKI